MSNIGKIFRLKSSVEAVSTADLKESYSLGKVMAELDPETPGGLRFHKPLGDCAYWNIDDVEEVKRPLRGLGTTKCTPPKFRNYRGRTWDQCVVIMPWGEKVKGHLDTTWGTYAYFQYEGQWYKFEMMNYVDIAKNGYTCYFDLATYEKVRL